MGHFFSFDPESTEDRDQRTETRMPSTCHSGQNCPPPVIPGKTEKMGHFFSFDPESTEDRGQRTEDQRTEE
ncbi:hypothetical protein QUF72_11100 [Desulfobacterales bacterium HSG2]|nr:hypothetical protein [Desulfobacterales bacterium HSG2]